MTPREQALGNLPEARRWAAAAIGGLNAIIAFSGQRSEIVNLPQFKAVQTHFHLVLSPPPTFIQQLLSFIPFVNVDAALALLQEIRFRCDIQSVLSQPQAFVDAPAGGGDEDVGMAPAFVPRKRDGTLRITPYYQSVGVLTQVHCLVHEAAHFISDAFQDHAYRDRSGELDPNKYDTLPVQFAIRNADSYAYFALQMAKGIDRVLSRDE
jgi:hypothetical protein